MSNPSHIHLFIVRSEDDEFYFASPDGSSYLEIQQPVEWTRAHAEDLADRMKNGRLLEDGRRFLPMSYARRYFTTPMTPEGWTVEERIVSLDA